jgi:hypothetical protein
MGRAAARRLVGRQRRQGFHRAVKEQSDAGAFLRRKEIERRRKNRHLDRKLERMLAMLFELQELRRALNPT